MNAQQKDFMWAGALHDGILIDESGVYLKGKAHDFYEPYTELALGYDKTTKYLAISPVTTRRIPEEAMLPKLTKDIAIDQIIYNSHIAHSDFLRLVIGSDKPIVSRGEEYLILEATQPFVEIFLTILIFRML